MPTFWAYFVCFVIVTVACMVYVKTKKRMISHEEVMELARLRRRPPAVFYDMPLASDIPPKVQTHKLPEHDLGTKFEQSRSNGTTREYYCDYNPLNVPRPLVRICASGSHEPSKPPVYSNCMTRDTYADFNPLSSVRRPLKNALSSKLEESPAAPINVDPRHPLAKFLPASSQAPAPVVHQVTPAVGVPPHIPIIIASIGAFRSVINEKLAAIECNQDNGAQLVIICEGLSIGFQTMLPTLRSLVSQITVESDIEILRGQANYPYENMRKLQIWFGSLREHSLPPPIEQLLLEIEETLTLLGCTPFSQYVGNNVAPVPQTNIAQPGPMGSSVVQIGNHVFEKGPSTATNIVQPAPADSSVVHIGKHVFEKGPSTGQDSAPQNDDPFALAGERRAARSAPQSSSKRPHRGDARDQEAPLW